MQNVLIALKDIPGVVGSFVLNEKGLLVSREMPAVYPDEIYPEMGRRLVGVYEAIASQAAALGDLVLKFDSYWFLCRRTAQCFLGVLTTESVNYPALKMATNVALKQIDEQVAIMPPLLAKEAAAIPAVEAAPVAPKQKRFFRGTPID
jgi:predicted regulator of Ras-like GTPase activity (Roadblock/LC7/MglB family)